MHRYDVAIIGGDAGEPVVASVAAQPGLEVALVEKEKRLDRTVAGNTETGFLKLFAKKGNTAGANAIANHAVEVIHGLVPGIQEKTIFFTITGPVNACPGYSQLDRCAASQYYRGSLFSLLSSKLVRIQVRWSP